MIRPLRRRHLHVFSLLLLVVPVSFWAALQSRKGPTVMSRLPMPLTTHALPEGARELAAQVPEWDPPLLASRLYRSPQGGLLVELAPKGHLKQPDLLLYWSGEPSPQRDSLPSSLRLLGSFSGSHAQAYPLPPEAEGASGGLILYSLAHQEIFSSVQLPQGLTQGED